MAQPHQLSEIPLLELGETRTVKRGLQVTLLKDGPVSFMLGPKGEFPATMPFEPPAFEGGEKCAGWKKYPP